MGKKIVVQLFSLLLGMNAIAFSAASPFSDVPESHWAYNAVKALVNNGINEGYGDGTFRGDRNITRYEVATMLAKILEKKYGDSSGGKNINFLDIPSEHWAQYSVQSLATAGISRGYGDGTFRGDRSITRYEMAVMVSKFVSKSNILTAGAMPFSDVPESHWASEHVKKLTIRGINEGYGDGTFRGDKNITRYEAAMMLARLMALT